MAAVFVGLATAALAASAVMATAQPASPQIQGPIDSEMHPLRALKGLDIAPAPSANGDDKAACDRAAAAQARFEAGISTPQERSRAMEHAKSLAASASMRRAIDSGLVPACPPDIERGVQP
ncbi:MAG TPA: hypothetical protein VHI71_05145 [Actinomycetota bacterium]|nr:hypothetical protein [Actinomycetota bacterium]